MHKVIISTVVSTLIAVAVFYFPLVEVYLSYYVTSILSMLDQPGFIDSWLLFSVLLSIAYGATLSLIVIAFGRRVLNGLEFFPPVVFPMMIVSALSVSINGHNLVLIGLMIFASFIPLVLRWVFVDISKEKLYVK